VGVGAVGVAEVAVAAVGSGSGVRALAPP
jgi:hypothetical protein